MACVLLILETTTVVRTCRKSWLDIYVCAQNILQQRELAVCILLMVIPKSLKLKYSSTKCRKSALKNKRITSTSESCTDSSQTNRSWFFYQRFCQIYHLFCCCCIVCSLSKRWKLVSLKLSSLRVHGLLMSSKWKGLNRSITHSTDNLSYLQKEGNQ